MTSLRLYSRILPCLLAACYACGSATQQKPRGKAPAADSIPRADLSVRGNFSGQTALHADSAQIASFFKRFPLLSEQAEDVKKFYAYRQHRFAWYDGNGLTEQADNLFNHLNNLEQEGVQTPVPYKDSLDRLFNDPLPDKSPDPDIEILLTAEYLFYARTVWEGIPEAESTRLQWYLPRKKLDLPMLMDSLLKDSSASLFSANYSFSQYNLLKAQLQRYRQLDSAVAGSWKALEIKRSTLRKGDSSALLPEIRRRLCLLGDLQQPGESAQFDDTLEEAVRSFQSRYGLAEDGVMGPDFFRELNRPPEENIRRIIVNMERMRWVPASLSNRYLIVNIPAFTLYAYDHDQLQFRMNVVVGRDIHKTVVFNGDLKYVVFSPYWNIPASIMKKEILPAMQKDPAYLQKNNMEWSGKMIRQKPGPSNPLGLVKFLFPNSHSIYLHDSPAKSLFNAQSRAFSHGCIRVADAKKLTGFLLADDPAWNEARITTAMRSGKEQYVTLKDPVPVFIAYITAWVDNQGRLNFRKDIYKRDQALEGMLIQ
jgi:murein L,D-transpeptidase YcbB/YkuD